MTGDNSTAIKTLRAYDRLILAILENKPKKILERLAADYIECPDRLEQFPLRIQNAINEATTDAKNYYPHRQAGRSVIVHVNSPLGKKLIKGAFNEPKDE